MNKKIMFFAIIAILDFNNAYAVPPPDFIIQVVSNLGSYFAIGIAFFSSIFFATINHSKMYFASLSKIKIITIGLIFILGISFVGAYFYDNYKQDLEVIRVKQEMNLSINKDIKNNLSEFSKDSKNNFGIISLKKIEIISPKKIEIKKDFSKMTISNKDFSKIYKKMSEKGFSSLNNESLILDAREDLEVQIGKMPGSIHIRFAELKNGDYKKLKKYKTIYVYCWSGIRGKEVALFLRTKGINAISLENGSKGWFEFGGAWNGTIKFSSIFSKNEYKKLFMKDSLIKAKKDGIILVDVRKRTKYIVNHITNSINVPLVNLPKNKWKDYIAKIPKNSKIITVCDDYVNCFYAKIVGIELEKKGFEFEGRYSLAYN